eukprot:4344004-Amphidinium_carterae.1
MVEYEHEQLAVPTQRQRAGGTSQIEFVPEKNNNICTNTNPRKTPRKLFNKLVEILFGMHCTVVLSQIVPVTDLN